MAESVSVVPRQREKAAGPVHWIQRFAPLRRVHQGSKKSDYAMSLYLAEKRPVNTRSKIQPLDAHIRVYQRSHATTKPGLHMPTNSRIEPLVRPLLAYLRAQGASTIQDIAAHLRCTVRDARLAIDRARAQNTNIINVQRYVFELRSGQWHAGS